jgi:predicted RNA-binding protein YlxR (DUF448 family)
VVVTSIAEVDVGERVRSCAVTRAVREEAELIRFVAGPDREVVVDLAARLPGRGVWVTCRRESVEEAVRKDIFSRALKAKVRAAPDLAAQVGILLRRRALEALSIANKAGAVVTGFFRLEKGLVRGEVVALLHAREAAGDGRDKLDRKLRAIQSNAPAPVGLFSAEELGLALGRSNVVHAGLKGGGASRKLIGEARRLGLYEGSEAAVPAHVNVNDSTSSE